jgi:hypothetical protein
MGIHIGFDLCHKYFVFVFVFIAAGAFCVKPGNGARARRTLRLAAPQRIVLRARFYSELISNKLLLAGLWRRVCIVPRTGVAQTCKRTQRRYKYPFLALSTTLNQPLEHERPTAPKNVLCSAPIEQIQIQIQNILVTQSTVFWSVCSCSTPSRDWCNIYIYIYRSRSSSGQGGIIVWCPWPRRVA